MRWRRQLNVDDMAKVRSVEVFTSPAYWESEKVSAPKTIWCIGFRMFWGAVWAGQNTVHCGIGGTCTFPKKLDTRVTV